MSTAGRSVLSSGRSCLLHLARVLGCALLLTAQVAAQEKVETSTYLEAVNEALAEYQAQNYPEARTLFLRAYKLYPNARALRGLGIVCFELRRYGESVRWLRQAVASQEKPLAGAMREEADRLLLRALGFVARLHVVVEPAGASVTVDGAEARPLDDQPLLLDLGEHQLTISAMGYVAEDRPYSVEGGEDETLHIVLRRESKVAPTTSSAVAPSAPAHSRARRRAWGVLAGTAVGLGIAGFVAAGVYTHKRSAAGDRMRAVGDVEAADSNRITQWQDTRPRPYAFGAVGAAALTSGLVGYLVQQPRAFNSWWAPALAGAAGVGLAAWGIADVARGDTCEGVPRLLVACSPRMERLDRGALVLMAAVPLLSVPLTRLLRGAHSPAQQRTALSFTPSLDHARKSVGLHAQLQWL